MTPSVQQTFRLAPAVGLFLARIVRAPLWLLVSALLARVLGPQGLGTWAMVLAAAMLGNQVLLLWTQSITQRFGRAEWLASGTLVNTWAVRLPAIAVSFAVAALLLMFAPLDWHMRYYGLSDEQRWLVIPALLALWLMGEVQSLQQVRERYVSLAWSPVSADLAVLATISLLAAMRFSISDDVLMIDRDTALLAIGCTSVFAWSVFLMRELRNQTIAWRLPVGNAWRRATLFALPLVPGYVMGYLAEWCDYFLIGYFYDAYSVGIFHSAYQYMLILVGVPTAIAAVLLPQVVSTIDSGEEGFLHTLLTRIAPQLTILWTVGSLLVIALLPALFELLVGNAYSESRAVLQVLLIAVPGAIVPHIYSLAYFAQGRLVAANLGLFGIKLVVNATISCILLPVVGVEGAAVGSAVSYLVLQWLFIVGQHCYQRLALGYAAATLAMAQLSAVLLVFVGDTILRVAVAVLVIALLVGWARRAGIFSEAELSAMIPRKVAKLLPFVTRVLCRNV